MSGGPAERAASIRRENASRAPRCDPAAQCCAELNPPPSLQCLNAEARTTLNVTVSRGEASSAVRRPFLADRLLARAQQFSGEIVERGRRQRGKRQRSRHLNGGEAEPRGEQAVEHTLPQPGRDARRNAVA